MICEGVMGEGLPAVQGQLETARIPARPGITDVSQGAFGGSSDGGAEGRFETFRVLAAPVTPDIPGDWAAAGD